MQLNCRRRLALQLTQLNRVQPISAKQVNRVFVTSAALRCVIYQPATFISWEMFSSAAAFLHGRWRLWSICHINRHVFAIILLTFRQILHSKIPSPGKLVKTRHIWRHGLQTESTGSLRSELIGDSCSRCERVDNSTSSWVELCRYKRLFMGDGNFISHQTHTPQPTYIKYSHVTTSTIIRPRATFGQDCAKGYFSP